MDPAETERRPSVKIHLALLASLGLYGLLLAQIRLRMSANHSTPEPRMSLFVPMLVLGIVEFAVISVIARRLFALGLAGMLGSFPTREAWQNAIRMAQTRAS